MVDTKIKLLVVHRTVQVAGAELIMPEGGITRRKKLGRDSSVAVGQLATCTCLGSRYRQNLEGGSDIKSTIALVFGVI